jgi:hypothetical protein
MSDLQDKTNDNDVEDTLTTEEQLKIESIQIQTFIEPEHKNILILESLLQSALIKRRKMLFLILEEL